MTAAEVTGWLERLEETHKAATPGPWRVAYPFTKLVDVPDREAAITAERPADAAAIVAAHNATEALLRIARTFVSVQEALEQWGDYLTTAQVRELRRAMDKAVQR